MLTLFVLPAVVLFDFPQPHSLPGFRYCRFLTTLMSKYVICNSIIIIINMT